MLLIAAWPTRREIKCNMPPHKCHSSWSVCAASSGNLTQPSSVIVYLRCYAGYVSTRLSKTPHDALQRTAPGTGSECARWLGR
eukprot:2157418-Rhodomonas_salina.1